VDSDVAAAGRHLEAERLQRPLERNLGDGPVDDQPECPVRVVPHEVDHRPGEPRIAERVGRDEQAARERAAAGRRGAFVGRRSRHEDRREEERGHGPTTS